MKRTRIMLVVASAMVFVGSTVHADLVFNGDFELGNAGFSSDLSYKSTPSLSDGDYAVGTDSQDWWGSWLHVHDHTSGSGLMFIATPQANNPRVWYQQVGVQAGVTYDFGVWAATVCDIETYNDAVTAMLSLEIENQLLRTDTLPAGGAWGYYSASWTADTSETVTIAIRDSATSTYGNDFALDDITFTVVAVPVPGAVLLGALGLGYSGWFLRRKLA